jgi:glycosyltransferase involved in cell wall biosynthesis
MKELSKISVVICTYNGEKYIREQLDSILSQTYPVYEIIIQDDGSTDNTLSVVQNYQGKFPVIQCFRNEKNVGCSKNFITAFQRATGDYIAPSDQDDIWFPHKIETMLNLIGDKMLCFSRSQVLFANGTIGEFPLPFPTTYEECIVNGTLAGHTCLFHKSMLPYFKTLNTGDWFPFDYIIALVAFTLNSFVYTTEEMQIWRRHSAATTKWVMTNEPQIDEKNNKRDKFAKLIYTTKNLVAGKKLKELKYFWGNTAMIEKQLGGKKYVIKLCSAIANQTLAGYIVAGMILVRHRHKFFPKIQPKTFRQKLALVSYSFRFPFTCWQIGEQDG